VFRLSTRNVEFQKHHTDVKESIGIAGSRTHYNSPSLFGQSSNFLISESDFSDNVPPPPAGIPHL
jgi:hypothetical protein